MNEGYDYRVRVGSDGAGASLLDYLARRYGRFSRDEWTERIRSGRVLLGGVPAAEHAILSPGQLIVWARPPWEEPRVPLSFAVLYHVAGALAVAKPSGLPTIPGGGQFLQHTLLAVVRARFPGASPLHRLGRATSGVVLFATDRDVFSAIARQWHDGQVRKVYRALVTGHPATDAFEIDVPIGPITHPVLGTVHAASPLGKQARSEVTVLERRDGASLVEVRIATGRPHQIRIHLAAAGHPLVGDPLYAVGGRPPDGTGALPGDAGYHLHSALVGFWHPGTGEWAEVACAPPAPLRATR